MVTGHIHRFAYRIIERSDHTLIPILVSPAISPVYWNAPAFLTADVAADGTIVRLEQHALVAGRWRDVGGLASLGVSAFTGRALRDLQGRLERDRALRSTFAMLYTGGGPLNEIERDDWRPYWCAATGIGSSAYRDCLDEGGLGFLTRRGVAFAAGLVVGVLVAIGAVVALSVAIRRRLRGAA
jgi:hypothetical protein